MKTFSNKKICVLGGTGLIGGALCRELSRRGASVRSVSRKDFDVTNAEQVSSFAWDDYDIIMDATGAKEHAMTISASIKEVSVNVLAPLSILSHLSASHWYVHCGAHTVLLPSECENPYSFSKKCFEEYLRLSHDVPAYVTTLRLPAIFADERQSGLLFRIKNSFQTRTPLSLDLSLCVWHTMYLSRVADIVCDVLLHERKEPMMTIGYPVETSIGEILRAAEEAFGYSIPVSFSQNDSDHFVPDVSLQNTYFPLSGDDFHADLLAYFRS